MNIQELPEISLNWLQKEVYKEDNHKQVPFYVFKTNLSDGTYIINLTLCGSVRRRYIIAIHSDWSSVYHFIPNNIKHQSNLKVYFFDIHVFLLNISTHYIVYLSVRCLQDFRNFWISKRDRKVFLLLIYLFSNAKIY